MEACEIELEMIALIYKILINLVNAIIPALILEISRISNNAHM